MVAPRHPADDRAGEKVLDVFQIGAHHPRWARDPCRAPPDCAGSGNLESLVSGRREKASVLQGASDRDAKAAGQVIVAASRKPEPLCLGNQHLAANGLAR